MNSSLSLFLCAVHTPCYIYCIPTLVVDVCLNQHRTVSRDFIAAVVKLNEPVWGSPGWNWTAPWWLATRIKVPLMRHFRAFYNIINRELKLVWERINISVRIYSCKVTHNTKYSKDTNKNKTNTHTCKWYKSC